MMARVKIGAKNKKVLDKLMRSSQKTAKLLAALPAPLREQLWYDLPDELESNKVESHGLTLHVPKPPMVSRSERLRTELDSLANKIDLSIRSDKTGPKLDYGKLNVAQNAYYTLVQFAPVRPTTTAAGPFYELASVYYEAVTGQKDVSMERQCRKFLGIPELR
jgi:hypothetical protein